MLSQFEENFWRNFTYYSKLRFKIFALKVRDCAVSGFDAF
jgi:hypothetical protein